MQYGHCVVSATATAINSLYLSGITPPLKAASSNATNPLNASGASSPSFLSFVRFFMSYIAISLMESSGRPQLIWRGGPPSRRSESERPAGRRSHPTHHNECGRLVVPGCQCIRLRASGRLTHPPHDLPGRPQRVGHEPEVNERRVVTVPL